MTTAGMRFAPPPQWLMGALLALAQIVGEASAGELSVSVNGRGQKYTTDTLLARTCQVPFPTRLRRAQF